MDLGGGLGVVQNPGADAPLSIAQVASSLAEFKKAHSDVTLWMEPGRYVVAESGVLLTRVTQIKAKGDYRYIGVDSGFNSLIRPMLYNAYHPIYNLSRLSAPKEWTATVVGMICESGDIFGRDRQLPSTEEGDVILIGVAGAYGHSMSSRYNEREPAREVFLPA